ncbi:MAG: extracellular solute-binding protein [Ruminococcaceae bacterium]|nr:extracellular solute-binding protein [Oscillospiraceae bacterium]
MKKLIALTLATVMLFALCACGENSSVSNKVSYDIPDGKVIPDDAVLNVTIGSVSSWPYDANWKVWQYIKEAIGGTVNVTSIPTSEFATKFNLIMASREHFPDVIGFQGRSNTFSSFCEQGAFVALDDYEEFLADYNAFWDSLPESEQWMRDTRRGTDGKIYYAPIYGMERATNIRTWMYREDIFKKHGLEIPKTIDELYEVSKELKQLYPDSYPFCLREGFSNINVMGSSWKPNFRYSFYYDFENEKWSYGTTESEVMYDIVSFLKKMVDEKLMPADFFSINTSTWQELVSTDRGFIMPEYQTRMDFFNSLARSVNPEFTLAAMAPPVAENGMGVAMVNKYNFDPMGFGVLNTGNEESIANAMRYVNWFYSDEGSQTISWGKEGETFEVVDGKKKFILPKDGDVVKNVYGFQTIGTYLRVDPEAAVAAVSAEQAATTDFILEYTYPELDPTLYMSLSVDDAQKISDLSTSLGTFVSENIQKFVLGQRPLSEWDKFQEELSGLPINDVLAVYEAAYQSYSK